MAASLGRRTGLRIAPIAAVILASLALAPSAQAQYVGPILNLGPISVADGLATVTGTVGGDPVATLDVTINGQPIGLDPLTGQFNAVVDLNGVTAIVVSLRNPLTGETVSTSVPVDLATAGGIIDDVLARLRAAGINLTVPPEGFTILDNLPLEIAGRVLDRDQLAGLTINGIDVLSLLRPDGTFTVPIPGTSREVIVQATDREGVSQTSTFPIQPLSSVIQTTSGPSVSAAGALGLRIVAIRYRARGFRATKRIRMIVTVKDSRGLLVRGASVRVRSARPLRALRPGRYTARTNRIGRVGFWLKPRARVFGKRLVMKAVARTASARAQRSKAVRVPRLARAR